MATKNTKRKPKKKSEPNLGKEVLLDRKLEGTEIHEQSRLDARGLQIPQDLSNVFVRDLPDGFQFDEEVGEELSEDRSVLVEDREWVLLNNAQPLFTQPMCKSVLVDLFR